MFITQREQAITKMSSEDDFYRPTNLRDSTFGNIQLPQKSRIQKSMTKNDLYRQDSDQQQQVDVGNFEFSNLGQVSNIVPRNNVLSVTQNVLSIIRQESDLKKQSGGKFTRPNSSQNQSGSQKSQAPKPSAIVKRGTQQLRRVAGRAADKKKSKNQPKTKQVFNLDTNTGQVSQWAHRDANEQQQDFDKPQQKSQYATQGNNKQGQNQLSKKAEQKANLLTKRIENRNFRPQAKKQGGLAAKAEQLRKKNQQQKLLSHKNKQTSDNFPFKNAIIDNQTSTDNLLINRNQEQKKVSEVSKKSVQNQTQQNNKLIKKQQPQEQQEQQDDYWQKMNEQTKKQYQKKVQIQKKQQNMSKEQVLDFYCKKFIFAEQDIQLQFEIDPDEEQVLSCWDTIFGCLKSRKKSNSQQKQKHHHKSSKDRMSMRLLAISKMGVSNTNQEFFVLKQIWSKLTGKKFIRYGNHWNQVGFQGRDPATDLRSTGFLSLLQWYLFIDENQPQAKEIFQWTSQHDFPLALTHIKSTGLFLKLLKGGKLKAKSWNDFQKNYSGIVWNVFKMVKKTYDPSINVGQVIDSNLQIIRKSLSQRLKEYDQHKQG